MNNAGQEFADLIGAGVITPSTSSAVPTLERVRATLEAIEDDLERVRSFRFVIVDEEHITEVEELLENEINPARLRLGMEPVTASSSPHVPAGTMIILRPEVLEPPATIAPFTPRAVRTRGGNLA